MRLSAVLVLRKLCASPLLLMSARGALAVPATHDPYTNSGVGSSKSIRLLSSLCEQNFAVFVGDFPCRPRVVVCVWVKIRSEWDCIIAIKSCNGQCILNSFA